MRRARKVFCATVAFFVSCVSRLKAGGFGGGREAGVKEKNKSKTRRSKRSKKRKKEKKLTGTAHAAQKHNQHPPAAAKLDLPVPVERRQVSDLGALRRDGHGRRRRVQPRLRRERQALDRHPLGPAVGVGGVGVLLPGRVLLELVGLRRRSARQRRHVERVLGDAHLFHGELGREPVEHLDGWGLGYLWGVCFVFFGGVGWSEGIVVFLQVRVLSIPI